MKTFPFFSLVIAYNPLIIINDIISLQKKTISIVLSEKDSKFGGPQLTKQLEKVFLRWIVPSESVLKGKAFGFYTVIHDITEGKTIVSSSQSIGWQIVLGPRSERGYTVRGQAWCCCFCRRCIEWAEACRAKVSCAALKMVARSLGLVANAGNQRREDVRGDSERIFEHPNGGPLGPTAVRPVSLSLSLSLFLSLLFTMGPTSRHGKEEAGDEWLTRGRSSHIPFANRLLGTLPCSLLVHASI